MTQLPYSLWIGGALAFRFKTYPEANAAALRACGVGHIQKARLARVTSAKPALRSILVTCPDENMHQQIGRGVLAKSWGEARHKLHDAVWWIREGEGATFRLLATWDDGRREAASLSYSYTTERRDTFDYSHLVRAFQHVADTHELHDVEGDWPCI